MTAATPTPIWRRAELWSAAIWTLYAGWRLFSVPTEWWRWRDDAVITLSHARGWVDFGVPSVSSAGERVEGYSAPLQMFLASGFYRLGGSGWAGFLDVQVAVGLALSGCLVACLLRLVFPDVGEAALVAGSTVVAVVGLSTWAALGWFASGMENSLTVPLLLATMVTLVGVLTVEGHRGYAFGVIVGLAGISRTEFAVLLVPVLAIAMVALWRQRRGVGLRSVAIAVSIWGAAYLWRWVTFRTLIPNSALVQDRTDLAFGNALVLVVLAVPIVVVAMVWRVHRRRMIAAAGLGVAAGLIGVLAARSDGGWGVAGLPTMMTVGLAGATVVAAIAAGSGVGGRKVWIAIVAIGSIPAMQQSLLGPARLDADRVGAQSLILLSVAAGVLMTGILGETWGAHRLAAVAGAGLAAFGIALVLDATERSEPQRLCCGIGWYATVLDEAATHSRQTGMPRSIVAAPDLGKYSFDKKAIVVDLGHLGDPVMAQIHRLRPALVDVYLRRVQPPDVLEAHGSWVCETYADFLTSDSFIDRYDLSRTESRTGRNDKCLLDGKFQYYRRSLDDPGYGEEIELSAKLARSPATAPDLITAAANSCANSDGDVWRCQWVRRAIQRATPEIRTAGTLRATVDALAAVSPTGEVDQLLLTTPPGYGQPAAESLIELLDP